MNILRKLQLAFPSPNRRMVRIESLPIAPAQSIHLIRVDGTEYLIALGGGTPAIVPLSASLSQCQCPALAGSA